MVINNTMINNKICNAFVLSNIIRNVSIIDNKNMPTRNRPFGIARHSGVSWRHNGFAKTLENMDKTYPTARRKEWVMCLIGEKKVNIALLSL